MNKAVENVGIIILKASERYAALPNREKGHVIGQTMFSLVNPEGSTEGGKLALQIADGVATKVDIAVMKTIAQSMKAAKGAASQELASQTKHRRYK